MRVLIWVVLILVVFPGMSVQAGQEVDRLLADYAKIESVTCKVRRTKKGAAGKIKFLTRIYFTNLNKIHSEKLAPVKQRTIVDGKVLYQYTAGSGNKGFSRPIDKLSDQMKIALKHVPGTAMDHLLRLQGLEETVLETTGNAASRVGIATESRYVVLVIDDKKRLTDVQFYKTKEMKEKLADHSYSGFSEVLPGIWVPFSHKIQIHGEGVEFSETVKIDRFVANQPIAESLFVAKNFFDEGIDFVDDFAKIFPD